jgi:hypothetical protein
MRRSFPKIGTISASKFKHIPRKPEENSTISSVSLSYVKYLTESALEEITQTLYVLETPDASNTVTNAYVMHMEINVKDFKKSTENATSLFDTATDGRTNYPRF